MLDQINWTLATCARIFRPVIRLSLAMGLKHPHIECLIRELLIDEAHRLLSGRGVAKPNISQLATTTGLNRKDVTQRVRMIDAGPARTDLSPAVKVFTTWLQLATDNPVYKRLPICDCTGSPSFEALARQASRGNVHHRAVLDDLIRLGMVEEHEFEVVLVSDRFVPVQDLRSMLAFLGDNTRDHLEAAVSNTLGDKPRMLERAVFADGLTAEECERIHRLARNRWDAMHHELAREMTEGIDHSAGAGDQRLKIGIYTYYEKSLPANNDDDESKADK